MLPPVVDGVGGPAVPPPPAVRVYQCSQPDLRQKLESSVQNGHTVLIEGVGSTIDPWLDTIITKQVHTVLDA